MTAASLARLGPARVWLPRIGGAALGAGLALVTLISPLAAMLAIGLIGLVASVVMRRRTVPWARSVAGGAVAVGLKELRGRMRGRRAFTIVTLYLALLAAFAWAVIQIQRPSADPFAYYADAYPGLAQAAQSAQIGQTLFAALLILLTTLVVFLAPAFTAGAISQERERQTFELLAATPLPATGIVLGKLLSALVYLFLLILASVPLMSFVFTFGGVAVDDVVRAYVLLIATALGLGALGLFMSALIRRSGAATILTYLTVLGLTAASLFVFVFWAAAVNYQPGATLTGSNAIESLRKRPPEALVWLNPTVGVADLMCSTGSGDLAFVGCAVTTYVTNTPYFGQPSTRLEEGVSAPPFGGFNGKGIVGVAAGEGVPGVAFDLPAQEAPTIQPVNPFGVPRDLIWPRIALSEGIFAVLLTLGSILLVSPARSGLRLPTPRRRDLGPPAPPSPAEVPS